MNIVCTLQSVKSNFLIASDISDLENVMVKNANWGQENEIYNNVSCAVNFSIVDSENSMQYLFQPWKANVHPRTLPDRQLLENAYLLHEHLVHYPKLLERIILL